MTKIKTLEEVLTYIQDDMSIMIGGFLGTGTPEYIINGLVDKGVENLTIIGNDSGFENSGIGKLITNKLVKKLITSHIGTNPETGRQMNQGEMEVDLVPQGTLAERIRSAGAGLGGFLTPTGIGTLVEEGKEKITIGDQEYLLELPLKADVALLKGAKVDVKGNIYYDKAARNFNPLMAMAAEIVIVEAEEVVEAGEIDPNHVMTPGIFVDIIVKEVK